MKGPPTSLLHPSDLKNSASYNLWPLRVCTFQKLGFATLRCLEKVPSIFSHMLVQHGDESPATKQIQDKVAVLVATASSKNSIIWTVNVDVDGNKW